MQRPTPHTTEGFVGATTYRRLSVSFALSLSQGASPQSHRTWMAVLRQAQHERIDRRVASQGLRNFITNWSVLPRIAGSKTFFV